jgi:hypothetical protein
MPGYVPGVPNIVFNGSSSYGAVADAVSSRIEQNNAFSYVGWIYFSSLDNNLLPRIWEKASHFVGAESAARVLILEISDTDLSFFDYLGSTLLNVQQWYHFVVTFDGSTGTCTMYVNGTAETVTAYPGPWGTGRTLQSTVGSPLYLARRDSNLLFNLQGRMHGPMAFYTRAISAVEAAAAYAGNPPTDGFAEYAVRDGSGAALIDGSGNSLTAALVNVLWAAGP